MKMQIDIGRKHLLYLVVFTTIVGGIGLGVAYNSSGSLLNTNSAGPMIMGHSPDEIFCDGCINDDNIADGANINGSKIDATTLSGAAPNLNCSNADTFGGLGPTEFPTLAEVQSLIDAGFGNILVTTSQNIDNEWYRDMSLGDDACVDEFGEGWRWCNIDQFRKYNKAKVPADVTCALKERGSCSQSYGGSKWWWAGGKGTGDYAGCYNVWAGQNFNGIGWVYKRGCGWSSKCGTASCCSYEDGDDTDYAVSASRQTTERPCAFETHYCDVNLNVPLCCCPPPAS